MSSRLLEILGRAITADTAELIWHWFDAAGFVQRSLDVAQYQQLSDIIKLAWNRKTDKLRKRWPI